jgi:hypothetical protein
VGEQAPGFWDGERDHAGVGGRGLIGPDWRWCLGAGAVAQEGGGDGADGQGGHDQHGVPGDRGVEADLGLAGPKQPLPNWKFSSAGQRSPAARISPDSDIAWPSGTWQ